MHGRRSDPSEIGIYTIAEVSRFVGANPETVRRWVHGRRFTQRDGSRGASPPLIETPSNGLLCFHNLVEVYLIHVLLGGLEDAPSWSMPRLRGCLRALRSSEAGLRHPLAYRRVVQGCLSLRARRIEWEETGLALRYRCEPARCDADREPVTCSPRIGFGRPLIGGVSTAVIHERFAAGESIDELAADYALESAQIEEAVRFERVDAAA